MKKFIKNNLANIITLSRLFLIPILFISSNINFIVISTFLLYFIFDEVDGKVARYLSIQSPLGAKLDLIVDRTLDLVLYLFLIQYDFDLFYPVLIILISRFSTDIVLPPNFYNNLGSFNKWLITLGALLRVLCFSLILHGLGFFIYILVIINIGYFIFILRKVINE